MDQHPSLVTSLNAYTTTTRPTFHLLSLYSLSATYKRRVLTSKWISALYRQTDRQT